MDKYLKEMCGHIFYKDIFYKELPVQFSFGNSNHLLVGKQ